MRLDCSVPGEVALLLVVATATLGGLTRPRGGGFWRILFAVLFYALGPVALTLMFLPFPVESTSGPFGDVRPLYFQCIFQVGFWLGVGWSLGLVGQLILWLGNLRP